MSPLVSTPAPFDELELAELELAGAADVDATASFPKVPPCTVVPPEEVPTFFAAAT